MVPLWAESAATNFLQQLGKIRTMQAHYTQVVHAQSREISRSSGDMALVKPGQFRWYTQQPVAQLIVADGKKIWIYDIDLEQVTVKKQTTEAHTGVGLLLNADEPRIARTFDVSMKKQARELIFELRAKSAHADVRRLLFHFSANTLVGMELFDALNQHTVVRFQRVVTNHTVSSQQFHFTPPPGVDVLDEGDARD
jgi:outer membrane lipoprotein carrier protein